MPFLENSTKPEDFKAQPLPEPGPKPDPKNLKRPPKIKLVRARTEAPPKPPTKIKLMGPTQPISKDGDRKNRFER